jgi:hypothetical protein
MKISIIILKFHKPIIKILNNYHLSSKNCMTDKNQYNSYDDYYLDNFRVEHAHPINRLLHFIGITLTYLTLVYGIFTLDPFYVLICMLPFITLSVIGHKLIERN